MRNDGRRGVREVEISTVPSMRPVARCGCVLAMPAAARGGLGVVGRARPEPVTISPMTSALTRAAFAAAPMVLAEGRTFSWCVRCADEINGKREGGTARWDG